MWSAVSESTIMWSNVVPHACDGKKWLVGKVTDEPNAHANERVEDDGVNIIYRKLRMMGLGIKKKKKKDWEM